MSPIDFSELHDELRSVARDLLAPFSPLGAGSDAPRPLPPELLAGSGWSGLEVPQELDGAGATFAEVAVVLEEMGRAASLSPYFGTVVLGLGVLGLVDPVARVARLQREIAAGRHRVAVAVPAGEGCYDDPDPFRLELRGRELRLAGRVAFVADAAGADTILVVARDRPGRSVVVAVERSDAQIEVVPVPVADPTRQLATIVIGDLEVDEEAILRPRAEETDFRRLVLDRAAVAIAVDSLGLAQRMLETTVAYTSDRRQFGRPIGSFQAVKHACADMLVSLSVGRELVAEAVDTAAHHRQDGWVAAARAKSYVTEAAVQIAGKAMQLHGGIGYTWESGVHFYLKRAVLNRSLLGSPAAHRRRLASRFS